MLRSGFWGRRDYGESAQSVLSAIAGRADMGVVARSTFYQLRALCFRMNPEGHALEACGSDGEVTEIETVFKNDL